MIYRCKIEKDAYEYGIMPAPVTYPSVEILIEANSLVHATKKFAKELENKIGTGYYTRLIVEEIGSIREEIRSIVNEIESSTDNDDQTD